MARTPRDRAILDHYRHFGIVWIGYFEAAVIVTMAIPETQIDFYHPLDRLGLYRYSSRVLIVGLGKTGFSVARFLASQGVKFAICDSREKPPYLADLQETLPDAAVFLGGFNAAAFSAATHLIVSPGVSLEVPEIKQARRCGIPVFGDLDLFVCVAQAPIVAITGSNGKSTVTSLVGAMAEADHKRVRVGGNLGTPVLDLLDEQAELYVVEVSSFQLERSNFFEPTVATVLNISPDHMDRYPDPEAYKEAKRRVFQGNGIMLLNRDDPEVAAMFEPERRCLWFGLLDEQVDYGVATLDGSEWLMVVSPSPSKEGVPDSANSKTLPAIAYHLLHSEGHLENAAEARRTPLMKIGEVRLKGRHNIANALSAIALGDSVGLSRPAMVAALRRFAGLDHRMQWVAEIGGVVWINDSKATNVGACIAALAGLDSKAVLIAGGDGKGADFSLLRPVVAEKVRAAVLMGKDASLLEQALRDVVPTARVHNMRQAVKMARSLAQCGDTVLLAPACASLDQYQDYQERGKVFAEAVRSIPA
jgi:UDP-N-acetylmuramoylalanine--D-glutamate ligase